MIEKSILVAAVVVLIAINSSVFAGATEIWFSDKDVGQWIYRLALDGTQLPKIGTGHINVKDLTVIGDEVWFSGNNNFLGRVTLDGRRIADCLPRPFFTATASISPKRSRASATA